MTLGTAEIGFWIALSFWVVAFLVFLQALVFHRRHHLAIGVVIAAAGLLPHTAGIVIRWIATGRPPFISLYELIIASAWFAVLTYLVIQAIWKSARPVGVAVAPVAFLSMGAALTLSPEANELSAALQSWWLVIHIVFALIAHGCFAVAFGAAVLLIIRGRRTEAENGDLVPSSVNLDRLGLRCIIFGFICHTVMVLSGAIWANNAWGRFWGWDPIETWSLVTWLLYGLYMHLRFLPKWHGRRAAAYAVVAFLVVVFSFWGVPHLWKSIHDYTLYSR
jgi:cytochrome c-type biogenesis protein CcsB